MKRLLLLVIGILSISMTYAQSSTIINYKVESCCYTTNSSNTTWSDWKPLNTTAQLNCNTKRLILNVQKQQIVDYTGFTETQNKDFYMFYSIATDTDYKTIGIDIYISKISPDLVYLTIKYNDYWFMYYMRQI